MGRLLDVGCEGLNITKAKGLVPYPPVEVATTKIALKGLAVRVEKRKEKFGYDPFFL